MKAYNLNQKPQKRLKKEVREKFQSLSEEEKEKAQEKAWEWHQNFTEKEKEKEKKASVLLWT